MDNQNKNFILAMALSLGVILIWSILFPPADLPTDPGSPEAVVTTEGEAPDLALTPPTVGGTETEAGAPVEATAEAPRIAIDTQALSGSISLTGGRLDDLELRNYFETLEEDSPNVRLLSPVGQSGAYYALYGWTPGGALGYEDVPGANTEWEVEEGETLTVETPVTLRWDNGAGLIFRRTISVDEDYMFTITQSVENTNEDAARLAPYGIVARHGLPDDLQNFFILHEGVVQSSDGTLNELDYDDMTDLDFLELCRQRRDLPDRGAPARRHRRTGANGRALDAPFRGGQGMGDHPQLPERGRHRRLPRFHRLGLVLLPDQADLLAASQPQRAYRQYGPRHHRADAADQGRALPAGL